MADFNGGTALTYKQLAFNQKNQSKHAEAEKFFRKAWKSVSNSKATEVKKSLFNLRIWQWSWKRKETSKQEAPAKHLDLRISALGELHHDTAISFNNLGVCWTIKAGFPAEKYLRKALEIGLKVDGSSTAALPTRTTAWPSISRSNPITPRPNSTFARRWRSGFGSAATKMPKRPPLIPI